MTPNMIPNIDFASLIQRIQGQQGGAALDAPMGNAPQRVQTEPGKKPKPEYSPDLQQFQALTKYMKETEDKRRQAEESAELARQQAHQIRMNAVNQPTPKAPGFPVRPGEGGMLAIGALLAKALGVDERTIGGFLQGYVGTKANDQASGYQQKLLDLQRQQQLAELEAQQQDYTAASASKEAASKGDMAERLGLLGVQSEMADATNQKNEIESLWKQFVTAKSTSADPSAAYRIKKSAALRLQQLGANVPQEYWDELKKDEAESDAYERDTKTFFNSQRVLFDSKADPDAWLTAYDQYSETAERLKAPLDSNTLQKLAERKAIMSDEKRQNDTVMNAAKAAQAQANVALTKAKVDETKADTELQKIVLKYKPELLQGEVGLLKQRAASLKDASNRAAKDAANAKLNGDPNRFRAGQVDQYLTKYGADIADADATLAQANAILADKKAQNSEKRLATSTLAYAKSKRESAIRQMNAFVSGLGDTDVREYAAGMARAVINGETAPVATYNPMGGAFNAMPATGGQSSAYPNPLMQGQVGGQVPGGQRPMVPTPQGGPTLDQMTEAAMRQYNKPGSNKAGIIAQYKKLTGRDLFSKTSPK